MAIRYLDNDIMGVHNFGVFPPNPPHSKEMTMTKQIHIIRPRFKNTFAYRIILRNLSTLGTKSNGGFLCDLATLFFYELFSRHTYPVHQK